MAGMVAGGGTEAVAAAAGGFSPLAASAVALADFLWIARPVVVFADSPPTRCSPARCGISRTAGPTLPSATWW